MPRLSSPALCAVVMSLTAGPARADRQEPLPKELAGVGITEHLGAQVPLDTPFRDEAGRAVRFGDVLRPGRPTILTLNYSNCAMLCSLQLTALVKAMRGVDWSAGGEFEVVTVSLDPAETPERARQSHDRYTGEYGRPSAAAGWHFLTGPEASIRAVADTVGFGYRWDEASKQFVHAPVLMLLRPDGKVARYLYGIDYPAATLRLSLRETADGKMISAVDQLILFCFHYDAEAGRYAPAARNLMRVGAAATIALLAAFVAVLLRRERRKAVAATGTHP